MRWHVFTRPYHVFALFVAALPLVFLGVFSTYVVRARVVLGRWPHYANPDPKNLGWWIQHNLLTYGFIILSFMPAIAVFAVFLAVAGRSASRDFPVWTFVTILTVSVVTWILFTTFDPGGFIEWFLD